MRQNIDKEKYYSIREISMMKLIPGMHSQITLIAYMKTKKGLELFQPLVRETPHHTRYRIKGSRLLEILAKINKNEIRL
jgi:hypothetical protein